LTLLINNRTKKFEVRRYIQEIGEIEADSMEDAALLLKYGHGPKMWKQESTSMRLVDPGNKMIRNIDDYKS
jgi:hypothetical protein